MTEKQQNCMNWFGKQLIASMNMSRLSRQTSMAFEQSIIMSRAKSFKPPDGFLHRKAGGWVKRWTR